MIQLQGKNATLNKTPKAQLKQAKAQIHHDKNKEEMTKFWKLNMDG